MLRDILVAMGEEVTAFNDDDFEMAFREFDINKSKTFEFEEVKRFILHLANLI